MNPTFFRGPSDFRKWLERNHAREDELWVGLYKKGSGKPSITWPEAVDEALCFGWIDGVRKSFAADSYVIRFTPRRPGSIWSAVNTKRAQELLRLGRMMPAGVEAFRRRDEAKTRQYSYERSDAALTAEFERAFRRNQRAWRFFQSQPPGYRRIGALWVMSAKREETRLRRLAVLIADSAAGQRISPLRRSEKPK
jgi:uncharacterized protein YdeI (YjbR/CyaY-like superfamily)